MSPDKQSGVTVDVASGHPAAGESDLPARALSLRQPWAELVMRGIKTIEVRSTRTKVRGSVQIYAGLNRIDPAREESVSKTHGVDIDALPRGVLVGTVNIVDCRQLTLEDSSQAGFTISEIDGMYAWLLESPRRFEQLRVPVGRPQPIFFYPFGKV